MAQFAQRFGSLLMFTLVALPAACGSEPSPSPSEPTRVTRQAFSNCVKSVEGEGDIGKGWVGLQTDGTLWRGYPAQKYEGLDQIESLGSIDGEALTWCVVRSDHTAWCWGANDSGQVGNGDTLQQQDPVQITALGDQVKQIVTSDDFACALKLDNTVWCWGDNTHGQLGQTTTDPSLAPVQVSALGNNVEQISAGFWHGCAKKSDDTLWCWGNNSYGEIGRSDFVSPQLGPIQVMTDIDQVSAGGFFTCAIDNAKKLYCWGDNADGHVGVGNQINQASPQEVTTIGAVNAVDASVRSACAIKEDSTVWCWGWQDHGRLGDGVDADAPVTTPQPVSGPLGTTGGAVSIHGSEGAACVVTTANELMCWGGGGFLDGQGPSTVPIAIDFCGLPRLNSIAPTVGSTLGGTQVSFYGENFDANTRVYFADAEATGVSFIDSGELLATAPSYFQATVDVRIENPGSKRGVLKSAFTFQPPPALYSALPASGPLGGGTTVTLQGSALLSGLSVTFGGAPATSVTWVSATEATAVTPAHAAGFVNIVVTNSDGQSHQLTDGFNYKAAPATSSLAPTSGPAGTQVVLTGSDYEWNTIIRVDGSDVSTTFVNETTIGITMPPHADGPVPIEAENADGQRSTLNDAFVYDSTGSGGAGGANTGGAAGSAGNGAGGSGNAGSAGTGNGGAGASDAGSASGGTGGSGAGVGGADSVGGLGGAAAGSAGTSGSQATPTDDSSIKCYCSAPGARTEGGGLGTWMLGCVVAGALGRRRRLARRRS
ncbi:MAG: IPT/TIG domain-containing protein [Myxococcales bacterium]|nr:IPT/TIG domain-containing protein [Myxococcales bacterium]